MQDAAQADPAETLSQAKRQTPLQGSCPAQTAEPAKSPARAKRLTTFCEHHDISRASVYRLIDAGKLVAHKRGGCTVILAESEAAYVASLPQKPAKKSS